MYVTYILVYDFKYSTITIVSVILLFTKEPLIIAVNELV